MITLIVCFLFYVFPLNGMQPTIDQVPTDVLPLIITGEGHSLEETNRTALSLALVNKSLNKKINSPEVLIHLVNRCAQQLKINKPLTALYLSRKAINSLPQSKRGSSFLEEDLGRLMVNCQATKKEFSKFISRLLQYNPNLFQQHRITGETSFCEAKIFCKNNKLSKVVRNDQLEETVDANFIPYDCPVDIKSIKSIWTTESGLIYLICSLRRTNQLKLKRLLPNGQPDTAFSDVSFTPVDQYRSAYIPNNGDTLVCVEGQYKNMLRTYNINGSFQTMMYVKANGINNLYVRNNDIFASFNSNDCGFCTEGVGFTLNGRAGEYQACPNYIQCYVTPQMNNQYILTFVCKSTATKRKVTTNEYSLVRHTIPNSSVPLAIMKYKKNGITHCNPS